MIIVTGATGRLGAGVVENLLRRIPAEQVGVSVRDPERARGLTTRGVRVRRGDFDEPNTLASAFEGATQVLVVSPDTLGDVCVAQSVAAVDAAYAAGAERVLYTSQHAADPDSLFAPARDHAAVEAHLRERGRPYVSLRNGFYATSLVFQLRDTLRTGELVAPEDGPVAWTGQADLAEGAAAILAGTGEFAGPTPPLTATAAPDLGEVASLLAELSGRSVRRVVVTDEEYVAHLVARDVPEPAARLFLGAYQASRRGEFAPADPALAILLGHDPHPVRTTLEAAVAAER